MGVEKIVLTPATRVLKNIPSERFSQIYARFVTNLSFHYMDHERKNYDLERIGESNQMAEIVNKLVQCNQLTRLNAVYNLDETIPRVSDWLFKIIKSNGGLKCLTIIKNYPRSPFILKLERENKCEIKINELQLGAKVFFNTIDCYQTITGPSKP